MTAMADGIRRFEARLEPHVEAILRGENVAEALIRSADVCNEAERAIGARPRLHIQGAMLLVHWPNGGAP